MFALCFSLEEEANRNLAHTENSSKINSNSSDYMTENYKEAYKELSEEIISEEEEEEVIEEVTESDYNDEEEAEDEEYGNYYGDDLSYSDEGPDSGTERHALLINAIGASSDAGGGDSNE